MHRVIWLLPLLLLFIVSVQADDAGQKKTENVDVKGIVVDADGKPVADVAVSDRWTYADGWQAQGGVTTDADGRFTFSLRTFPNQATHAYHVQAGDKDRGALVILTLSDLQSELKLTLQPFVAVTAKLVAAEGFPVPDDAALSVYWKSPFAYIVSARTKDSTINLTLPAGEYSYMSRPTASYTYARGTFVVPAGEKTLELEPIKLVLNPLAACYGKEPPAVNISYVRNLPEDIQAKGAQVTLADFKGRWVLVEFWGFW